MVDPETFALNLMLIIGAFVLLGAAGILSVATWTGASVLLWVLQRRRAHRAFIKETRREDGKPYPPFAQGVCEQCHRGSARIYLPPSGEQLCPVCYERSWRHKGRGLSAA